jgi:hypothetical protein
LFVVAGLTHAWLRIGLEAGAIPVGLLGKPR